MNESQTATAPHFDPDEYIFDPVRAGFTQKEMIIGYRWEAATEHFLPLHITLAADRIRVSNGRLDFYLPANLPHNAVLSILRANGWEG